MGGGQITSCQGKQVKLRTTFAIMITITFAVVSFPTVLAISPPSIIGGGPFGLLRATGAEETQSTESLASQGPTPDSAGGTVVATIPVGNGPHGAAYNSGNGYVYVTNEGSNKVSVIKGTIVVAMISVGIYPEGAAYNSENGYIYVTNDGSNNVSVINGTVVVATIPVGNGPDGAAYNSGNGYIYVTNEISHNVSVINGTALIATIPVGKYPRGVTYNSGNGYVYVTNDGSNDVSVIDGTTVVATIPVGNGPWAAGYNSRNGYVYVANLGSNNVSVINGTTVVATIPAGTTPAGVAYNTGNGYVYLTNAGENFVSVIDGTTVVETIPVGNGPYGVAYDGGDGCVYVTNALSDNVSVICPPLAGPPTVMASVTGDKGTNGWFKRPATLTLTAEDTGGGVKVITYSVAGGAWQNYAAPLTFSDGTYVVKYTATDWAGNSAHVETVVIRVDSAPPRVHAFVSGTRGAEGWFTSLAGLSLNASDTGSGVQRLDYRLDRGAARNYSGPITLSEGLHSINATAADVAGNVALDSIEVRIDATPPVLQLTTLPATVSTGMATVSWSGYDNISGISGYELSVDRGMRHSVGLNASFTGSLPDGSHTITIWAVDAAGNAVSRSVTLNVDTNIFSPSGPYAGTPTYSIIVAAAAVAGFFFWKRRRRVSPPPASPPQGGSA